MLSEHLFNVGDCFGKTWTFDEQSVKAFASLVGDTNPLHHDAQFAKNSRFGRLIVSGTQYTAIMMGMVAAYVSERNLTVGLNFSFDFKKAIFANDTIDITWQIDKIDPNEKLGGDLIYFVGKITNQHHQICTTSNATLLSYH